MQFNYTEMNEVMRILKQYNCTIYKNETQLFCAIETGIPKYRLTEILYALENIQTQKKKLKKKEAYRNTKKF